MGIRLIAYIDDILVLAESRDQARCHAEALVYLLQCLGFKEIGPRTSPGNGVNGLHS